MLRAVEISERIVEAMRRLAALVVA